MTRLGIIGRADYTGLADQTLSVARALGCDAALILDLGLKGRGPFNLKPWTKAAREIRVTGEPQSDGDLNWLLDRSDVVYTPECPPTTRGDFPDLCSERDIPFFIHVNPELWRNRYRSHTTRVILPTDWHADRFPDAIPLPMPVDRKRFPFKLRTKAREFFHLGAPAMDDRAGTHLVRAALEHVQTPITLYARSVKDDDDLLATGAKDVKIQVGNVTVKPLPQVADHADVFPDKADVFISPRRYGGLSLPYLAAASLGMPIISLDLPPQNAWLPRQCVAQTIVPPALSPMIGGAELCYDAQPALLATIIDRFANEPALVEWCSKEMDGWAEAQSWETLRPRWLEVLGLEDRRNR